MKLPFEYEIWTDGACQPNPGNGGWAAIIVHDGKITVLQGCDPNATNNTMEMTAAIEAMRALPDRAFAIITTDSKYVLKGATQWMAKWKRNGWMRGKDNAELVKNANLWRELDRQQSRLRVHWQWVRGHSGDVMNERVDGLAVGARLMCEPEYDVHDESLIGTAHLLSIMHER